MLDLFAELLGITETLEKQSVPYALVGGLAYSVYVEVRATEDIDLLVFPEDWDRIPGLLGPLGYRDIAGPMDFEHVRIRRLTKLEPPDALVLDFLLAGGSFRAGVERALVLTVRGRCVRVAPVEILIALKRSRMSDKDRSDIAGLEKLLERRGTP
jgi:hypothetical protein